MVNWFKGAGYTSNAFVSFVGGGGSGASNATVDPSSQEVVSILITEPGAGYVSAPKVFIPRRLEEIRCRKCSFQ